MWQGDGWEVSVLGERTGRRVSISGMFSMAMFLVHDGDFSQMIKNRVRGFDTVKYVLGMPIFLVEECEYIGIDSRASYTISCGCCKYKSPRGSSCVYQVSSP